MPMTDMAITVRQRDALMALDKDLTEIAVNLRWAYFDGYQATRPADRGRSTADDGTDNVKGPRFDIGIGNLRSREAFVATMHQLSLAEVRVALALTFLAGTDPHMPLLKPQSKRDLETGLKCIELMRQRIGRILTVCEARELNRAVVTYPQARLWPEPIVHHLGNAYLALQEARASLTAALPPPSAPGVAYCRICNMRPQSPKAGGGRCDTCYRYVRRYGKERPLGKDRNPNREALAAKRRREAAGLGFGHG